MNRTQQIAEVLARHGLGYLQSAFGLERFRLFGHGQSDQQVHSDPRSLARHIRLAMEELGATFIKLGQLLSTRPDLLTPEFQSEFEKLQDDAPPISPEAARERIEAELGRSIEQLFAGFDDIPLAAASIGQAHAATLQDGTQVVIKVRRPGVVEQVEEDLEILHNLAAAASRRWELANRYDVLGLVREFTQTLRAELDYIQEGQNAERFAARFADDPSVHIPRVFWETTTSRVLTLERIRGTKVSDLAALDAKSIDRSQLAVNGTKVILKMIFEDGFFHADLHPGNFFIESDGRFGLIDFGMVGLVDERTQDHLAELLMALTSQDYNRMAEVLLGMEMTREHVDRHLLRNDLRHLIAPYYGRPLSEITIGPLLNQAFTIIRRYHMHLPPDLVLLVKTIIVTEGLGMLLDPTFRLTTVIAPYADRLMLRQYSPSRVMKKLGRAGLDTARLGVEIPQQLRRILSEIERGSFEFGMRPGSVEPLMNRFERLANRIVLGVITSAFIIGLAVLLSVYHPPGWERWSGTMFAAGFFIASVLGVYLAWSILRSGRSKRG